MISEIGPGGVLVHEWVEPVGGSENVLEVLAELMPQADLVCTWMNAPERFPNRRIVESALARSPLRDRKALALPASALTWRALPNHGYQWALVSSHAFAHHVRFRHQGPDFRKLVYVHSPARYVWNPELDARGAHPLTRSASAILRPLDRRRAAEAASVAANSHYVRQRVLDHWGRDAEVIYPPVEVGAIAGVIDWSQMLDEREQAQLALLPSEFAFGASRLIPYKRLDLVIEAAQAAGLPAVIAGGGPLADELTVRAEAATVPVFMVGKVSDALLRALYQRATVFIFPAVEDFGIMPVEAMAAGTPAVVSAIGGTAESVIDGLTGAHVADWADQAALRMAVRSASSVETADCRSRAMDFSREHFGERVLDWVTRSLV